MPNKVAIITGASGGIGLATAALFAEKGYAVYGLSRKPYDSGPVIHIPTDVTDASSVRAAVSTVIAGEGRIDVLVCNAGFGISGAIEFTEPSDAKRQFDVNFFGALHCIQAVLPQMRAQHSGCILCVSSVAAVLSIPFQSFYSAALWDPRCGTYAGRHQNRLYRCTGKELCWRRRVPCPAAFCGHNGAR